MGAPDRITTVVIATTATLLLATVSFALAAPPAPGPDDADLPVIATTVNQESAPAEPSAAVAPSEVIPAEAHESASEEAQHASAADNAPDDDHETVAGHVRVEDPDDEDGGVRGEHSDDSGATSDERVDGESSHESEADSTHD